MFDLQSTPANGMGSSLARSPRRTRTPAYERRLILFIDFLGFKEVVASTERDPTALGRLLAALDTLGG